MNNELFVKITTGSAWELIAILQDHVNLIDTVDSGDLKYWESKLENTEAELQALKKSIALSYQEGAADKPHNPVMNPFDITLCVCQHPMQWHDYALKDNVDQWTYCRFSCDCTIFTKADPSKLIIK